MAWAAASSRLQTTVNALKAIDLHDMRQPLRCYSLLVLPTMASNMDTFVNLLSEPLESPAAGSLLSAEQPQQNADDVDFKLPLRPASAYRKAATKSREGTKETPADRTRELEPGEANEPQPQMEDRPLARRTNNVPSAAMPCPSDTKSARRLRKRKLHFSIDHPKAGTITYGRVPIDPQVMDLSDRPFLESYRTSLQLASASIEYSIDDDPKCLRGVELLAAIRKERNS